MMSSPQQVYHYPSMHAHSQQFYIQPVLPPPALPAYYNHHQRLQEQHSGRGATQPIASSLPVAGVTGSGMHMAEAALAAAAAAAGICPPNQPLVYNHAAAVMSGGVASQERWQQWQAGMVPPPVSQQQQQQQQQHHQQQKGQSPSPQSLPLQQQPPPPVPPPFFGMQPLPPPAMSQSMVSGFVIYLFFGRCWSVCLYSLARER
jgi:hypothetical protein